MDRAIKSDTPQGPIRYASEIRPHDLLWISGAEVLSAACALPEWVQRSIAAVPVVVVRRDIWREGVIPVGIRGRTRSERFAAFVALREVRQRVTPEDLANERRWRENQRPEFAAIHHALESIAERWKSITWGPVGSVGFELATGVSVTTNESDLDLVIRARESITKSEAKELLQSVVGLAIRTDAQVETPLGAVALAEYAAPVAMRILMKTCAGPVLITDPWAQPMPAAV
ncbi:MAG TPA: malonate decarboxylase holo-ACP synthase [Terracidiphilus sp.]|nr:malonate decarboxylase holo-ACP synthase [Terracidiphilus sp.]